MASRERGAETGSSEHGSESRDGRELDRATPGQVVRQAGVVVLVVVLWSLSFMGFLRLTSSGEEEPAAPTVQVQATQAPAIAEPTATRAAAPTGTLAPTVETGVSTATLPPTTAPEATEPIPIPTDTATADPGTSGTSFSADVLPLLQSRCERCHGGRRTEAGFSTVNYSDLMAGSYGVSVVVPGSSQESRLVKVIVSGDMPRRSPPMPQDEIDVISAWIDEGALDN